MGTIVAILLLVAMAAAVATIGRAILKRMWAEHETLRKEREANGRQAPAPPPPIGIASAIALGLLALALLWTVTDSYQTVDSGHAGIPVGPTGVAQAAVGQGLHWLTPGSEMVDCDLHERTYTMSGASAEGQQAGNDAVAVLTSDGVKIPTDVSVRFAVPTAACKTVYVKLGLGDDLISTLVRPTIRSAMRDASGGYTAFDIAGAGRDKFGADVEASVRKGFERYGIEVRAVQLRDQEFPAVIKNAIEAKAAADQKQQQKQFELAAQRQQAEIDRVNAKAKADAQQIIACGGTTVVTKIPGKPDDQRVVPNDSAHCNQSQLTPEYLEFLRIQMQLALANSPNSTFIFIPQGAQPPSIIGAK